MSIVEKEVIGLERRVSELERENAELRAHVERLREAFRLYEETGFHEILENAFGATPTQSLADIDSSKVVL